MRRAFAFVVVLGVAVFQACSSSTLSQCVDACESLLSCAPVGVKIDCNTSCTSAIDEAALKGCTNLFNEEISCEAAAGCKPSDACTTINAAYEACIDPSSSNPSGSSGASSSSSGGFGGSSGSSSGEGGGSTVGSSVSSSSGGSGAWGCGTQSGYCYCDTESSGFSETSCSPGWSCCRYVSDDMGSFCQCTSDEGSACDSAWSGYPTAKSTANCPP